MQWIQQIEKIFMQFPVYKHLLYIKIKCMHIHIGMYTNYFNNHGFLDF